MLEWEKLHCNRQGQTGNRWENKVVSRRNNVLFYKRKVESLVDFASGKLLFVATEKDGEDT